MACYHPIDAWRSPGGAIVFQGRSRIGQFQIPCGQCIGCRLERSRQWAVRCLHEAQLHSYNSFITLTYSDEHFRPSLEYKDFQNFMKRLRKSKAYFDVTLWKHAPSYYMCGEYGEQYKRPHFHACLFGCVFPDRTVWKAGSTPDLTIYRSKELEGLWPFGFSSIGEVTFASAAYVARYIMKKINGNEASKHYERVDADTGEIINVKPEFNRMSLKPAIGKGWIEKYQGDVYPHDYVIVNGHKCKPPRYYDKYLETVSLPDFESLRVGRNDKRLAAKDDNTPERLKTKEAVTKAKHSLKKRNTE